MATAQTTRGPRTTLTKAQRAKIRGWRSDLGHAIWNLNESSLVHELRRQYELKQQWDPDDMLAFSGEIEKVMLIALEIRHELAHFLSRKRFAKQYKDRLEGALEGIWLGVGYLRHLTPGVLDKFIAEHLGEDFELAEMLFFGFCPIAVETTREMPRGSRVAVLEEHVEQLHARERVAKSLDLQAMAAESADARRKLQRELATGRTRDIHERGGCYVNGMKALRASVMQMFYTLQARDVRRVHLSAEDSENWHQWLRDIGEPPQSLVDQMDQIAEDEGRVVHVFDTEQSLLYVAMPVWYTGEDPDSLKERASLKQSKKARQRWGHDYRAATPSNAAEFRKSLTKEEQRRVTRFLERQRDPQTGGSLGRSYTMEEIAAIVDVPYRSPQEAEFQRRSAAQFSRNPGTDWTTELAHNHGLHKAIWMMDL